MTVFLRRKETEFGWEWGTVDAEGVITIVGSSKDYDEAQAAFSALEADHG